MNEKIELNDTVPAMLMKISQANPGALAVCVEIMQQTETIDPQNILGGVGVLLGLDDKGLRGSAIWELYSDYCDRNVARLLGLVRAEQLGFLTHGTIKDMGMYFGDHPRSDMDAVLLKVRNRLDQFDRNNEMGLTL